MTEQLEYIKGLPYARHQAHVIAKRHIHIFHVEGIILAILTLAIVQLVMVSSIICK
jgi:hypothetical protein